MPQPREWFYATSVPYTGYGRNQVEACDWLPCAVMQMTKLL
jgi:hypothetical protein